MHLTSCRSHPSIEKEQPQTYGAGVGDTSHHTSSEFQDGGRRASKPINTTNDDRAGQGMGYGGMEGIDTRGNKFEKDMKTELVGETRSGIGQGYDSPGVTAEGVDTRTNQFEKNVRTDLQEFEDGHSDTEGAAGSHARSGRVIKEPAATTGPTGIGSEKFRSQGIKKTTPANQSAVEDFEDGHSDTEGGSRVSRINRSAIGGDGAESGHSDPARATGGPHQTFAANALDPRADAGVDSRRRGSVNQY